MRYAIFSDVHSNLQAFEAVVRAFKEEAPDAYLFIGDIVGYGADPLGCIDLLKGLGALSVAGNHDWAAIGRFDASYFNPVAREAIEWTAQTLGPEGKAFLEAMPLTAAAGDITVVHASLSHPGNFEYLFTSESAQESFVHLKTQILFVGHTHVPGVFSLKGNSLTYARGEEFRLQPQSRYIVNVGSVGQPRDGDPRACFFVYDTQGLRLKAVRVAYDVEGAQGRILDAGLPPRLAHRLSAGH